jgi:hypothetical protein
MKALFLIAITAMLTWCVAVGTVGKKAVMAGNDDGYVRGVSDLATQLTSQWGAIGKSEEVRQAATRLISTRAVPAAVR